MKGAAAVIIVALAVAGCAPRGQSASSDAAKPWARVVASAAPEVSRQIDSLAGCRDIATEEDLIGCAIIVGRVDEATLRVDQEFDKLGEPPEEISDQVARTRGAVRAVLSVDDEECFNGASRTIEPTSCDAMVAELRAALQDLDREYATWPATP